MLQCYILLSLSFHFPKIIFSESDASSWERFDIQQSEGNRFVWGLKLYFKGLYSVPAGTGTWGGKKRSGGRVAVQADLHRDFSIVCLHVCSAPCQIAAKT